MIRESLQNTRTNAKVLVENKICFAGPEAELGIYDTFEQANKVALKSDQLLFCGMVTGKKVMHSSVVSYSSAFYPHESFIMAPNQGVEIDFPEAKLDAPTTCIAIEISKDKVNQVAQGLNAECPLDKVYGEWQYQDRLVHTHHNTQTQNLLNRIVQIYTENHEDRSSMIDLAISELTIRLLRHQTRDFLLHHSGEQPDFNGLNSALYYIQHHLADVLDIDILCRLACMGRTKFFHQFKAHIGCSPIVYQQQLRLKKAARMIEQGQQISQVCYALGYGNSSHFSRVFKQFYGCCPRAYKIKKMDS